MPAPPGCCRRRCRAATSSRPTRCGASSTARDRSSARPSAAAGRVLGPGGALRSTPGRSRSAPLCLTGVHPRPGAWRATRRARAPALLDGLREGWREVRSRQWIGVGCPGLRRLHGRRAAVGLRPRPGAGRARARRRERVGGDHRRVRRRLAHRRRSRLRWRPRRPLVVVALGIAVASARRRSSAAASRSAHRGLEGCRDRRLAVLHPVGHALQEHVPEHVLSRVSSYDFVVTVGLSGLGIAVAGPVADAVGLHATHARDERDRDPARAGAAPFPAVRNLRRVEAGAS